MERSPASVFVLFASCSDAGCYEVCTGGSLSACRPPVMNTGEMGVRCVPPEAPAAIPLQAPFTCMLVDAACSVGSAASRRMLELTQMRGTIPE